MLQQQLLKRQNILVLVSGLLIALAFIMQYVFQWEAMFAYLLMVAAVIGVLPIAIQAYQALKIKVISIDLLVTIAVIGAFLIQNYEEAAIVSFLFIFGSYLEQRTLQKTRSAIQELVELMPETALRLEANDEFVEVDLYEIEEGDILLVRTGDLIPVDGEVIFGTGYANEASITGEAEPVGKEIGSEVFAGTLLENGTLHIKALQVGEDTTFGKIIELVEEAQDTKSSAERFIDRFAKYYTPAVLFLGGLVYLFTRDVELAITTLVLGCPGALVIGVPVSNVAGIGNGARNGVLLKGSEVIQDMAKTDVMVFDKTGTLTIGKPEVSDVHFFTDDSDKAKAYLVSVERQADHPLAHAIVDHFPQVTAYPVHNSETIKGKGVIALINEQRVAVGNQALMEEEGVQITSHKLAQIDHLARKGNSLVLLAIDGELQLVLGVKDQLRPHLVENLQRLKAQGVQQFVILSGDNQQAVDQLSDEIGLTTGYGQVLPHEKAEHITRLQEAGHTVCFVGDGINDSPSLALADVGIAMGSGTDVAIETSDVVLMHSDFDHLVHAFGLARNIRSNMWQNILIALGTVGFLLWSLFFTEWLTMSIGMLVHEGSILVVILNGMRLLRFRNR